MVTRRDVLLSATAETDGMAVAACGGSQAASSQSKRPLVLVHGAWHGAWCFERIAALLSAAGHPVTARDLPGHGLDALFPASYSVHPRDSSFNTEPSPLATITLADYSRQVVDIVNSLLAAGQPAPVLVGHSMGGIVVQAVAEALGRDKIHHVVYISGFMPTDNTPITNYFQDPTFASSLLPSLLLADPAAIGALRLDPDSSSAAYVQQMQDTFYGDVDASTRRAATNLLTPDVPISPEAKIHVTTTGWGAVPRTYLRCDNDKAIPPACQDLMIAQADAFSPSNKTNVVPINSSHSPFFSQPQAVVNALLSLA